MFQHFSDDPRDRLAYASQALGGLTEMLDDIVCAGKGEKAEFDQTRPNGLRIILGAIHQELEVVEMALRDYVPRDTLRP
jgi:hypothetical protein